jgi:hypothetical protein
MQGFSGLNNCVAFSFTVKQTRRIMICDGVNWQIWRRPGPAMPCRRSAPCRNCHQIGCPSAVDSHRDHKRVSRETQVHPSVGALMSDNYYCAGQPMKPRNSSSKRGYPHENRACHDKEYACPERPRREPSPLDCTGVHATHLLENRCLFHLINRSLTLIWCVVERFSKWTIRRVHYIGWPEHVAGDLLPSERSDLLKAVALVRKAVGIADYKATSRVLVLFGHPMSSKSMWSQEERHPTATAKRKQAGSQKGEQGSVPYIRVFDRDASQRERFVQELKQDEPKAHRNGVCCQH